MDLESLKRLNTPHFCQWYLKRLHHILAREKRAEYSGMSCESFDDLSKIVEQSQYQGKWDVRAKQWVSNNPVIYCHARIAGDSLYETRELTEDFIRDLAIALVPFFPNYIKEYKAPQSGVGLETYFYSINHLLNPSLRDQVSRLITEGRSRRQIADFIFDHVGSQTRSKIKQFVIDNFEPPFYAFDEDGLAHGGFNQGIDSSKFLIFPNKNLVKKVLTPPAESVECSTVETKQEGSKEMSKAQTVNAIAAYMAVMSDPLYSLPNISRSDIHEAGTCKSFAALAQKLKEEGARTGDPQYREPFTRDFSDLVWYDYHSSKIVLSGNLEDFGFLLPVPKSALPNGDLSVLFMSDATSISITKGSKLMSTIKETGIKSKDQVIKTAIGQAGVAGIKSLILTALPMKIGFIGRLLGRHKQVANNSVVVAGIAILANQIGQQYVKNDSVKNALQATQDQALSEVLNEYVGIENKVDAVVTNALQLDKQPVTLDQE